MGKFSALFFIAILIIPGAVLLQGKPLAVFTGSPAKTDSVSIDTSACKASCERSKVSKDMHKQVNNGNASFNFNAADMSMTFEKTVTITSGKYILKNNRFNGGIIRLDLTDALYPKMWSSSDAQKKSGSLKIIRLDTIGNDISKCRVIADFHVRDTTGRISFPATVNFSDSTHQKPSRLQGNFVIDALAWKLFPVDTNATVTKDGLNFILDVVSKKQ